MKKLWDRIDEVRNLGQKQEEQGLAEVPENADNGEHHPSKVAVRVADEHFSWVPVGSPQG